MNRARSDLSPELRYAQRALARTNHQRMRLFLPIIFLVHLAHVPIFLYPAIEEGWPQPGSWRYWIVLGHLVGCLISGVLWILVRMAGYRKAMSLSFLLALAYLLLGSCIALADQLVTTAITPYIIACIGIGLGLLLSPRITLALYTAALLFFWWSVGEVQTTESLALTARVNALTITALGWILGVTLRKYRISEAIQQRTIALQKIELRIAVDRLQETVASRERLFSIIAHDLRGPIGTSRDMLQVVTDEWSSWSEEDKLQAVRRQSVALGRSFDLLDQLLQWASRRQGALPFQPREVNLAELYLETEASLHEMAHRKNVTIHQTIESGCSVRADRSMLQTIIRNLLSNAIKFSPEGGEVRMEAARMAEGIRVTIKDDGVGMDSSTVARIAEGRAEPTIGSAGEKGVGMGLLIVQDFLHSHGSNLEIHSSPAGSRFSFTLPD